MNKKMIKCPYFKINLWKRDIMSKIIKLLLPVFALFLFNACSSHNKALEVLPNELQDANQCINKVKSFEMDCYDLISYKNSIAQLRLGLNAQYQGNFEEALARFELAKKLGNFYANALISDMYLNGFGVELNEKKAISLLKDTRKVDPIAAYKLSSFYLNDGDISGAISLLEFAGVNGVRDAQNQLSIIYSNSQYIEPDDEKTLYWKSLYEENNEDLIKKIYGR